MWMFLIDLTSILLLTGVLMFLILQKRRKHHSVHIEITEPIPSAEDSPSQALSLHTLERPNNHMGRGKYLLYGTVLLAVKYNLDRLIAALVFKQGWSLLNYLGSHGYGHPQSHNLHGAPSNPSVEAFLGFTSPGAQFYLSMALISLPFIWAGIVLTIRRLRDLKLSPGWVLLFFVPFVNILMFILLSILPTPTHNQQTQALTPWLDRFIPNHSVGSATLGVFLTMLLGLVGMIGSILLGSYGWGLFLGLPFCVGLFSVLIDSYHQARTLGRCLAVAAIAISLLGAAILALAFEGIICLIMAAPIGLVLALMGGAVGYALQIRQNRPKRETSLLLLTLALSWPLLTGAESQVSDQPPVYAVESVMDINAQPETVWNHVVTFSQLPEPTEWVFHTGIAYPIRAEIRGQGVGAIRHCIFSTGEFVEPIEVWDKPNTLAFGVQTMPMPMHEWSYKQIHPPHLDQYLQVTHGQFRLQPLSGNRTRLIGTTWYSNKVWPSLYWKSWSDGIIHTIHLRVLRHIKALSENT